MKLIILDPRRGTSRTLPLPRRWYLLLAGLLVALPLSGAVGGYLYSRATLEDPLLTGEVGRETLGRWRDHLAAQKELVSRARESAEARLKALTIRMAEIQARVLRLDALGERLARKAHVGNEGFDFSEAPAVGGPVEAVSAQQALPFGQQDFQSALDDLMRHLDAREAELKVLEGLVIEGRLREENFLARNPVRTGYLSSTFGNRIDPFHGTVAFHKGIDYAGPPGSEVVATGAGIVLYADRHPAYGLMVEISHGEDISTLYAHAETLLVKAGDLVQEGQAVATLGSTGRSTGPHVHYEVRVAGVPVNPSRYVNGSLARNP